MFYVYLLYRDAEPLWRYVGKGQVYSFSNDPDARVKKSMRERKADRYRIVFKTKDEKEALWMEHRVWRGLRDRGFTLANKRRPNLHNFSLSEETKAKIGATNRGRKFSLEVRAKLSAIRKGRKLSVEHRRRLKEIWQDPEFRRLISEKVPRRKIMSRFDITTGVIYQIRSGGHWSSELQNQQIPI